MGASPRPAATSKDDAGALTALIGDVKRHLSHLVAERPLAAAEALQGLASWADVAAARAQACRPHQSDAGGVDRVARGQAPRRRLDL